MRANRRPKQIELPVTQAWSGSPIRTDLLYWVTIQRRKIKMNLTEFTLVATGGLVFAIALAIAVLRGGPKK